MQIADEQAKMENLQDSGVGWSVNRVRLGEVLVAQAEGRRRYAAHTGLRRLSKESLKVMISGKHGVHLKSSINAVYRGQTDWTNYEDGRVPLRPVPKATFDVYIKDLWTRMQAFDQSNPHATQADREAHGQHWIDTVALGADWFRFPEFYEYGH